MRVALPLDDMSLEDKFLVIETVWADIVRNSADFSSPAWHGKILSKRAERLDSGEEEIVDWDTARELLRTALLK